jgi:hypothetical protein
VRSPPIAAGAKLIKPPRKPPSNSNGAAYKPARSKVVGNLALEMEDQPDKGQFSKF